MQVSSSSHGPKGRPPCRNWSETGSCPFGESCRFWHQPKKIDNPAGPSWPTLAQQTSMKPTLAPLDPPNIFASTQRPPVTKPPKNNKKKPPQPTLAQFQDQIPQPDLSPLLPLVAGDPALPFKDFQTYKDIFWIDLLQGFLSLYDLHILCCVSHAANFFVWTHLIPISGMKFNSTPIKMSSTRIHQYLSRTPILSKLDLSSLSASTKKMERELYDSLTQITSLKSFIANGICDSGSSSKTPWPFLSHITDLESLDTGLRIIDDPSLQDLLQKSVHLKELACYVVPDCINTVPGKLSPPVPLETQAKLAGILQPLTDLKSLKLTSRDWYSQDSLISYLTTLTNLQNFELCSGPGEEIGCHYAQIFVPTRWKKLKSLKISYCTRPFNLQRFKNLETLDVCLPPENALKIISTLTNLRSLTSRHFLHEQFPTSTPISFSHLPNLTCLDLGQHDGIPDSIFEALHTFPNLKKLTIRDKGNGRRAWILGLNPRLSIIRILGQLTKLESLHLVLEVPSLSGPATGLFTAIGCLTNLQDLHFQFGGSIDQHYTDLSSLTNLVSLKISDLAPASPHIMNFLRSFTTATRLQTLTVRAGTLSTSGLFIACRDFNQLRRLDVFSTEGFTKMTEADVSLLGTKSSLEYIRVEVREVEYLYDSKKGIKAFGISQYGNQ